MTKTFSRARAAKAAAQNILNNHEIDAEIETFEVETGRFSARVICTHGIDELALEDLEGFEVSQPNEDLEAYEQDEDEDEQDDEGLGLGDEEGEALPEITKETPKSKSGYVNEHSNHQGVVAEVHAICDHMQGARRKDVIEVCRRVGIAYGTARTQYQKWFNKNK